MLRLYNSINQKNLFPKNVLFILDCCELMRLVWDLQISTSVRQFYFLANSCIMFSSWLLLKSIHKGGLTIFPTSSIIYQFICQFEDYIERTTQLQENWLQLPNMYQCVLEKVDWKICISVPSHPSLQSWNILLKVEIMHHPFVKICSQFWMDQWSSKQFLLNHDNHFQKDCFAC